MIGLEDRRALARDITQAHAAGARLRPACEVAGIELRTLQRWQAHQGLTAGDGRPQAVRPIPSHALSQDERARLLAVANEPRFAAVPPARIVPMLADEGVYLASESSFTRVLRAQGQTAHRGRAKAPRAVRPPTTHIAAAPRQVWCWDMTYLPAQVLGRWFHLYLILDLYSVCVWPWHLELSRVTPEHRVHGEHGGCGLRGGDGVGRALAERRRGDRLDAQAGAGLRDGPCRSELLGFSRRAATGGAATPRSGCSTALAAA